MLLTLVTSVALALPATPVSGEHGKLPWYEGTFAEALVEAEAENKILFIDFWTDWCHWCKELDKETFSNDGVVVAMENMILLSVDAESKTGLPIAEKFGVRSFPSLLFLNSDGSPRDLINGFMPPQPFIGEVNRIASGKGTIDALRKSLKETPDDLDLRYELAGKLEGFGDKRGRDGHYDEILKRDPEHKNFITRRIAFDRVRESVLDVESEAKPDPTALVQHLAGVTDAELLYEGHQLLANLFTVLADSNTEMKLVAEYRAKALASQRLAWKHCPEEQIGGYGNALAWSIWENREGSSAEARAFALEVALKAVEKNADDPNVLDTLACCYFMNGKLDDAVSTIRHCIELQPLESTWQERLELFSQGS